MTYAAVLIKPDAIRDILEEAIIRDLRAEANVRIIFRKYWFVQKQMVGIIYPDWISKPEFPSMTHNMLQGQSLLLIAKGESDIYTTLKRVKGKMNQGGLRLKYRTKSIEEWGSLGFSGEGLKNKIAENRIHSTDTIDETVALCSLAMSSADVKELTEIAPLLAHLIWRSRMLCRI
jgi:nucleoside diphosphate kinase